MDWFIENKEWFFSGIGATLVGLLIYLFPRNDNNNKKTKMTQKSGKNSKNMQAGRDVKL